MTIPHKLFRAISEYSAQRACYIQDEFYTYQALFSAVSKIRALIRRATSAQELIVGVMVHNDLHTYASILALWMEGRGYLPIKPDTPSVRNQTILQQAGVSSVLDSAHPTSDYSVKIISTTDIQWEGVTAEPEEIDPDRTAYLLFTSGSTGIPKGVPVTFSNVDAFFEAFDNLGFKVTPEDRFLQMFELTFDMSVLSFTMPLLHGASFYTIPSGQIKYLYALRLMEEQALTYAIMVPSVICYLQPYFEEIELPAMREVIFAGEALYEDLFRGWANCVPNARLCNAFGPSEGTIVCTAYFYRNGDEMLTYNGIVAIGKAMKGTTMLIVDDENEPLTENRIGEICIAGNQLFPGYVNERERNENQFFNNANGRFYKTGDLGTIDNHGYFYFAGRKDEQVKINGFRVELTEIEYYINKIISPAKAVVVAVEKDRKANVLTVIIEGDDFPTDPLTLQLRDKLPDYMIPSEYYFLPAFPQNSNGKTDKRKMKEIISSTESDFLTSKY